MGLKVISNLEKKRKGLRTAKRCGSNCTRFKEHTRSSHPDTYSNRPTQGPKPWAQRTNSPIAIVTITFVNLQIKEGNSAQAAPDWDHSNDPDATAGLRNAVLRHRGQEFAVLKIGSEYVATGEHLSACPYSRWYFFLPYLVRHMEQFWSSSDAGPRSAGLMHGKLGYKNE